MFFFFAVSQSKMLYFFGKMSNSPRGEAQMYPKLVQELYDFSITYEIAMTFLPRLFSFFFFLFLKLEMIDCDFGFGLVQAFFWRI